MGVSTVIGLAVAFYITWKEKDKKKSLVLLENATIKYKLPLKEKEVISHDTRRFRFSLPTPDHVLGLQTGQHVLLTANINGEVIIRAYTPVTSDDDHGFVDLVVKVGFYLDHERYTLLLPSNGKIYVVYPKLAHIK